MMGGWWGRSGRVLRNTKTYHSATSARRPSPTASSHQARCSGGHSSAAGKALPPEQVDEGIDDVVGTCRDDVLDAPTAQHLAHAIPPGRDGGLGLRAQPRVGADALRQAELVVDVHDPLGPLPQ